MKLQTQIRLGLLFLLALLLLTGGTAIFLLYDAGQDISAMETVVVLCLLLAGTFVLNFPALITRPLQQMAGDIREIAAGRFDHRVVPEAHNEFGEIAEAVNHLAATVEEHARPQRAKSPAAALKRHLGQLEQQHFGRLSPEQLLLIAQIRADCQRLLQSAGTTPEEKE